MTHQCSHHDGPALPLDRPAQGSERQLANELIDALDRPAATIAEIAVGAHFIGIRADADGSVCAGLASTLGAGPSADERQLVDQLVGKSLKEAAGLLKTSSAFSISLGAAALNAGIVPPESQPGLEASTIMAEKGQEGETVLVGEFPFVNQLRQQVKTLHLFELRDVPGATSPAEWDAILGRCQVLGLTGTTLLTRAMTAYLEKAPQAYTIVIGPTTPLSPVLFSHGADVLAGCRIVSVEPVFEGIRKGLSFRAFKKLGVEFVAWSKNGA
ncbi:hypothetical protein DSCO28_26580 [Desulfosarcina ovata subsp. sediminis]|uniref:Heavy-metal chelation domain-containing protein n=1 Tax=Desulfosarcina ovata subsp. sediminis TaxID=885957 RepID=A0A5K7ZIY6_9BACT|nr:DUF364 domain-containing protein [Desulfosarcina ovata]BBO82092.1 hypothetical protein DSCO28_26580 [Desulfosarcina ovata subsp. sediminis]